MTRFQASILLALLAVASLGCGQSSTGDSGAPGKGPLVCGAGLEAFGEKCVDPAQRYEPPQRIDQNNVSSYGTATSLDLPDPPKSGFRIIAPAQHLEAGGEVETCVSWPYPKGLHNTIVYAGRLYTTPGLHHSNVIAKPINTMYGANPYPKCNPGASDPFSDVPAIIPDVLFANTTQVLGGETLAFPRGLGYRIDTTREISTDIHYLNASAAAEDVEVAYDFFTMPDADLVNEVAAWTLQVDEFDVAPHTTKTIETTCNIFGGELVSMMPHTHKFRTHFGVDFVDYEGKSTNVISDGKFDTASEIVVYDPELDLTNVQKIHFACTFDNTTTHDIVYGIGENEMCTLFGYVYPVKKQFVGHSPNEGEPCQSFEIGLFR